MDTHRSPNFGDVKVNLYTSDGMEKIRRIYRDIKAERGESLDSKHPESERSFFDYIYNFDDDYLRNPLWTWEDDKIQDEKTCRRNAWHRKSPMDCNSMHELDLQGLLTEGKVKALGKGGFRDVFLVRHGDGRKFEEVVFKQYHFDSNYDHEDFEYMRIDSLVTELFTSSSLFLNIYSNCGLSTMVEAMGDGCVEDYAVPLQKERGYIELDDKDDVDPKNNLTITQKVNFALDMAESLAMMHNYPGGVIVHDDVHLEQFLLTKDHMHVRIQDFNRAEIMLWNSEDEEYCRYRNGPGHGTWRSPEEYRDLPLDEKIDVWSLGSNLYAMLTGLNPFYEIESGKAVKQKIKEGKIPPIDPRYRKRSFGEQKLVEAIEHCWVADRNKRSNIYDVVKILREAATNPTGKATL
ncbi:hypothetical protein FisN_3Lh121 [Fistulifera solaris]|uniref:Protein kinase domain-containing protein n=1 Tax=Fistulifera solaris TaxID=1519565 RepID=A0A1Z5KTI7_FISSO|nr:hypothetical protein FisN_3Lh121 [Fistulifera solaris]|eukprot:GAX29629.1 hypothetical protein FisN_3Lh121 [Fistulifera solaris]